MGDIGVLDGRLVKAQSGGGAGERWGQGGWESQGSGHGLDCQGSWGYTQSRESCPATVQSVLGVPLPSYEVGGWDPAPCGILALCCPCSALSVCSLSAGGAGGGRWALVLSL